jgi:predicted metal-dependent hydrolase
MRRMEIPYKVVYRKVKYPRLEFKGLQLLVILPPEINDPSKIIEKGRAWIQKKWNMIQEVMKQVGNQKDFMIFGETYMIEDIMTGESRISYTEKKIYLNHEDPKQYKRIFNQLKKLLKIKVKSIIEEYTVKFRLKPNKVFIKRQQTKWGSCSSKGNIALNLKLVCLPEQMVRYVIFHELTHLKYKRHNQAFWHTISQEFPNYKEQEQKLFKYWFVTEMLFQNLTKHAYRTVYNI